MLRNSKIQSRLEPESRHHCNLLQRIAAARRALSVTRRYFIGLRRLPKLRVAGSNPVSRSTPDHTFKNTFS